MVVELEGRVVFLAQFLRSSMSFFHEMSLSEVACPAP